MAIDKVTVERDMEEWLCLSVSLEKHFEQYKELITVENELFFRKAPTLFVLKALPVHPMPWKVKTKILFFVSSMR